MSEVKTEATEVDEKKSPLTIEVAQEDKLPFPTVAYSGYMTSDKLCQIAKPLFSVFKDFHGFGVYFDGTNPITLSAFFNQVKEPDEFTAFECASNGKDDKSSGIQRIQRFEMVATEGNKFHITDAAKEMIAPFMHSRTTTNNGEVNWDRNGVITVRAAQNAFSAPIVYSVINYIDPIKVLSAIYGSKANIYVRNDNGTAITEEKKVAYQLIPSLLIDGATKQTKTLGPEGPWNLWITQVDLDMAHIAAEAAGVGIQTGPRIIV